MLQDKFWENKKVLITGHTGFKGSWLLIWLLKMGAKVYGYSLKANPNSLFNEIFDNVKNNFTHLEGDILDYIKLKNFLIEIDPDIILHLAAQSLVINSYSKPILTWETNLIGSLNILEASKEINKNCSIIMVTTDKVYENTESKNGYQEDDRLGGFDPYSASKAGAEIAIKSWRSSFCSSKNNSNLKIATARSGNVIGGGDWAENRLIPDIVRALKVNNKILIRNPKSTRPWQHVLEPLRGYLLLAEKLYTSKNSKDFEEFNFGPNIKNNKNVEEVLEKIFEYWNGEWEISAQNKIMKETKILHLNSFKAKRLLNWEPRWDFEKTIFETISWYQKVNINSYEKCLENIKKYCLDVPL